MVTSHTLQTWQLCLAFTLKCLLDDGISKLPESFWGISSYSVAVIKPQDQGNLWKKGFQFHRVRIHYGGLHTCQKDQETEGSCFGL